MYWINITAYVKYDRCVVEKRNWRSCWFIILHCVITTCLVLTVDIFIVVIRRLFHHKLFFVNLILIYQRKNIFFSFFFFVQVQVCLLHTFFYTDKMELKRGYLLKLIQQVVSYKVDRDNLTYYSNNPVLYWTIGQVIYVLLKQEYYF